MAGPDPLEAGKAYSLSLPPPRHTSLKDFRILLIDSDPLLPTDKDVRAGIEKLAANLGQGRREGDAGKSAAGPTSPRRRGSICGILLSLLGATFPPEVYAGAQAGVAQLAPDDMSLRAERLRGVVLSHSDWVMADSGRTRLRAQWRELFKSVRRGDLPDHADAGLCAGPVAGAGRRAASISTARIIPIPINSPGPGSRRCPDCRRPRSRPGSRADGLPVGVQIVGPYLEDRTPLKLAELIEREFGGFVPPKMFDD